MGVDYFSRPGPEAAYFHSHFGLEINLLTLTCETQTPNAHAALLIYLDGLLIIKFGTKFKNNA